MSTLEHKTEANEKLAETSDMLSYTEWQEMRLTQICIFCVRPWPTRQSSVLIWVIKPEDCSPPLHRISAFYIQEVRLISNQIDSTQWPQEHT